MARAQGTSVLGSQQRKNDVSIVGARSGQRGAEAVGGGGSWGRGRPEVKAHSLGERQALYLQSSLRLEQSCKAYYKERSTSGLILYRILNHHV